LHTTAGSIEPAEGDSGWAGSLYFERHDGGKVVGVYPLRDIGGGTETITPGLTYRLDVTHGGDQGVFAQDNVGD
jgi:hypothetical protein